MDTQPVSAGDDGSSVRAAQATHVVFAGGPPPSPADASALTEVWYRPASGGSYALHSSVREGVTRALIDGLQGTTAYYVKLRHNRGGAVSDYSSETLCYTRVESGYGLSASGTFF